MMNYSDYDSDGYSSNEDADYVPSDDNLSEDDINECEKEEPLNEGDDVPHPDNTGKKKKKKKDSGARKRAKGVLKLDEAENKAGGAKEAQGQEEEEEEEAAEETTKGKNDEDGEKKKSDDLWAKFLSGVETKPKDSATPKVGPTAPKIATSTTEQQKPAPQPAKVTITKILDFAGEEVRVTKEVAADSREAKNYLKSQSTAEEPDADEQKPSLPSKAAPAGPSAKRPAGMSSILNRIGGKKPKMSTLEKSKLDWDAYKSEEGITEELAIHNRGKDGYVERKNFLERVDHRQFEHEKAVRLSNMKQ